MSEGPNVIWTPHAGSQALALACPADVLLYDGTRGPGKTDLQVMDFRQGVGLGYGPFWRGIIFDQEYKNLDDVIRKTRHWYPKFNDGARFLSSKSDYKWVWPTGEELLIRAFKDISDYWDYHGHEYSWIGWNELTKWASRDGYDMMMSCNRTSFIPEEHPVYDQDGRAHILPPMPLRVRSTTNPFGAGHNWVKREFKIGTIPAGQIQRTTIDVFNPRTQQVEPVTKTKVRIFGSYRENRHLTPEYVATLHQITNAHRKKAWLHGDWNIVAGGAFDDLWDPQVHVIDQFQVPEGWRLDRSFDWGGTHPFSIGWWAEANGEEAYFEDGRIFCPPPGTLIRVANFYGAQTGADGSKIGSNVGLGWTAKQIAEKIVEVELEMKEAGWFNGKVYPGPADNQIHDDVRKGEVDTIAKVMAREGVTWERSNKSPHSRKSGLDLIRSRLQASMDGEDPGIYWTRNCTESIELFPSLQRDPKKPDDIDTKTEDHDYDETRYRVLAGKNRLADNLSVKRPR